MTTPDAADAATTRKSGSLVMTLGVVLVLSAAAAGGGWYFGGLLAPQHEAAVAAAEEGHGEEGEGEGEGAATGPSVVPLEPIMTNLSYPSENWVRMEVSLVFKDLPDTAMATQIHQDILAYLRTVSLQQIEGPRGFQHLRDDLTERVALRSEGSVSDLMFRTFVIE